MLNEDTVPDTEPDKDQRKHNNDIIMTSANESYEQTNVNMQTPAVEHLELRDRDPTDMNRHVRVSFE